jgi:hypothetical protein
MTKQISSYLGDIGAEFADVDLGDVRRNVRLQGIAERVAAKPSESFPRLVTSIAEREALYRLLSNDSVAWSAILRPHVAATVARGTEQGLTRVVHDTTDFVFSGDREGMGTVMQDAKGFFGHFALAVSGGEARIPLGVVGMEPYTRTRSPRTESLNARKMRARKAPRAEKESSRWERVALAAGKEFSPGAVIHVMDQEADDFVLMAELQGAGQRFVIRGSSARQLERDGDNIQSVLDEQCASAFRSVPLSKREPARSAKGRKAHPPRKERVAQLRLRWSALELGRPQHAQTTVAAMSIWVVQVFEPDPPPDETAIGWTLLTSERVENLEAATAVVDHYRARWRIEEYFRALKQGCAVQKRQLESYDAMLCALAIFIPIAWRLLLLRSVGQDHGAQPAGTLLDDDEMAGLQVLLDDARCYVLPRNPTVRDVMLAIARLGGHIPNNGEPGWLVLGRGFEDVQKAAMVWRAARLKRGKK